MILTAAIGWLAQTVLQRSAMYSFMQTVEEARHVGLDKKDLLMEVRRLGAAFKTSEEDSTRY
jgi:hypothetical protein